MINSIIVWRVTCRSWVEPKKILVKEIEQCLGGQGQYFDRETTLTLLDGRKINHLYYGSGHLHQLNMDGQVINDMERDDLHREAYRTQDKLTSCFGYDATGRKAWQYASTLLPTSCCRCTTQASRRRFMWNIATTRSTAVTS